MKLNSQLSELKSNITKPAILLCCPSALDPLGHPEMAFSILKNLILLGNKCSLATFHQDLGAQHPFKTEIINIHLPRFSKYTLLAESRKLPRIIRYLLRMYTNTRFYLDLSKKSAFDNAILL